MRKPLAAGAVAASMLGGAVAGIALITPSIASAETSSAETTAATDTAPAWMTNALQTLVDAGTITQAQADSVAETLHDARPAHGPGGPGGRGGPPLAAVATAIGIDGTALREALQSGQTIAEVAAANDVDVETVIDALVADMQARLADAVANGRLAQAEADEKLSRAESRATDIVNRTGPPRGADAPATAPTDGA